MMSSDKFMVKFKFKVKFKAKLKFGVQGLNQGLFSDIFISWALYLRSSRAWWNVSRSGLDQVQDQVQGQFQDRGSRS